MSGSLTVVKIGGKVLEDKVKLSLCLDLFSQLSGAKILVHGGGRKATDIAEKLGIEASMIDGRRVTNEAMMDVALMVYGGLINKSVVAQLQARKVHALGMTGADLDVLRAHKREVKTIDYGLAGDIDWVNVNALDNLLKFGQVPVMAPITHDGQGLLLNTNADTIATKVAIAMSEEYEVELILCFEKKGVLQDPKDDESFLPELNYFDFQEAKSNGSIAGGMIPKLDNGFGALVQGVSQVRVTRFDQIGSSSGTLLIHSS